MYNHDWYKIVSQAMIDSLLRQYNYDSILNINIFFVDISDDNRINFELSRRNQHNKNISYNNSRRVSNMNVDDAEAVSNNEILLSYDARDGSYYYFIREGPMDGTSDG